MNPEYLTDANRTFLYRFLTHPHFRIARHGVLAVVLAVVSFNQIFIFYRDSLPELGNWTYLIIWYVWCTYAFVVYFNILYLLPRYLLRKRYLSYITFLSLIMLLALAAQIVQESIVCWHFSIVRTQGFSFGVGMVMDYVSSFSLDMLCMIGGTMTVLLKLWMDDNQRVRQLEKMHVQSEVVQLKEQVSPELLFKILNRSGQLASVEGEKASEMLMKLSQLLRYQLYDCSRERVLLRAEINFLVQYLSLEQLYSPCFSFSFSSSGEVTRRLVPPLLFIPFVQHAVKQMGCATQENSLTVHLEAEEDDVVFTCLCPGVNLAVVESDLYRIRQRLDLQYKDRYDLLISGEMVRLVLKGEEV